MAIITHDPVIASFSGGHMVEGPGYRIVRARGSTSWLVIVTVSGRGWVGGADRGADLVPGEAVLLAPNHPHAYRTAEGSETWELRWAHFHPRSDWGPILSWNDTVPGLRRTKLGAEFEPVVQALDAVRLHGLRSADVYEERLGMATLESALVRIRRAAADEEPQGDPRLRRAVAFTLRHLHEPIGPEEMAAAAALSPSRLGALFRQEIGVSPRAFLERQRIAKARQLLAMTDLPVKAISAEVGFASEFYFANRFRHATGLSPTACRAAARRGHS